MIDEDPEEARKTFVSHEGKMKLAIDNQNCELGNPSNDWDSAVACFLEQVNMHVKPEVQSALDTRFSCTTDAETVAKGI
eukprot:5310618-Prymnesium_polylepis.1